MSCPNVLRLYRPLCRVGGFFSGRYGHGLTDRVYPADSINIRRLYIQKAFFQFQTASVTDQSTRSADYPVARDYYGHGVPVVGHAYGAACPGVAYNPCDMRIAARTTVRYGTEGVPYFFLEIRAFGFDRHVELSPAAGEVFGYLGGCAFYHICFVTGYSWRNRFPWQKHSGYSFSIVGYVYTAYDRIAGINVPKIFISVHIV